MMRPTTQALVLLTLVALPVQAMAQQGFQWTMGLPKGQAVLPATWGPDLWPLGITPVTGPQGRLWMIDQAGTWSSEDAVRWDRVTDRVPWGPRTGQAVAFFENRLWVMGGRSAEGPAGLRNDIWFSQDGVTWHEAVPRARWVPREGATAVVHDGKLWLIGGVDAADRVRRDVWWSRNALDWYRATDAAAFPARPEPRVVSHAEQLWMLGGTTSSNEVWSSSDGKIWTQVTSRAPWPARSAHAAVAWYGRLWILGGQAGSNRWLADAWSSTDGKEWAREPEPPWDGRAIEHTAVFDGKLWFYSGRVGPRGDRQSWLGDVWYLEPIIP